MNNEDSEENLETLQEYIDWCFDVIVMKKNQNACSPAKSETPSSKRSRPADSPETTSPTGKSFTRHSGFNRQAVVQLRREVVPGRDPAP